MEDHYIDDGDKRICYNEAKRPDHRIENAAPEDLRHEGREGDDEAIDKKGVAGGRCEKGTRQGLDGLCKYQQPEAGDGTEESEGQEGKVLAFQPKKGDCDRNHSHAGDKEEGG